MTTHRFTLIIAVTVIAALAVLTLSMVASPRTPTYSRAYDQAELARAQRYAATAGQQAYLAYPKASGGLARTLSSLT